jgi:membrane associated rhomboid family serine protease
MEKELQRLKKSIYYPIGMCLVLWFVKAFEWLMDVDLGAFGILPRTWKGTSGILFGGFLHGDVLHLMSNTIPLVLLGGAIVYFYHQKSFQIIAFLYLLTGLLVWIFARPAYHIGASGLVYGMLSFLFFGGLLRRDRQTLAISFAVLVLYGGSMFSGLVPGDPGVSWESHLIGFILGMLTAIYLRKVPVTSYDYPALDVPVVQADESSEPSYSSTIDKGGQPIVFQYHYKQKDAPD